MLRVLDRSSYNRPEPKDEPASHESEKAWSIEEQKSFRRLESLERSTADIPHRFKVITVCDWEGDMAD
ncbi:MAG: hypothetical protein LBB48_07635 [Treponema sp.]|nr:hypothetical protein [Treponema sp.]